MDHENAKQRIRPRQLATAAPPHTSLASLLLPAPWKKLPHDFPIVRDQLLRKLHGHHAQYTERSTKRQIIRLTLMGQTPRSARPPRTLFAYKISLIHAV